MRNKLSIGRSPDGVRHQHGLMREKHDLQGDLRSVRARVAPDAPEVTRPWNAARMNQQTGSDVRINRKRQRQEYKQLPPPRISGKTSPAGDQQQNDRRRQQAASQIVENLPPRDLPEMRLGRFFPLASRTRAKQPARDLPVAARPTMLTSRKRVVVRRDSRRETRCPLPARRAQRSIRTRSWLSSVCSGTRSCSACSNASTSYSPLPV